jgi:hypothetical protein
VIQALLKKGDKALDRYTSKPNFFSVYRYHMNTRQPSSMLSKNSKDDFANVPKAAGATQSPVSESKNGDEDTGKGGPRIRKRHGEIRVLVYSFYCSIRSRAYRLTALQAVRV